MTNNAHNPHYFNTVINHEPAQNRPTASTSATASTSPSTFTPAQQSLQARNKPFNSPMSPSAERYEANQKRHEAVTILENEELLMWFSQMRNESLQATRAHYTNISVGLEPRADSVLYREEFEVPLTERVPSPHSSSSRTPRKSSSRAGGSPHTTPKSSSRSKTNPRSRTPASPALMSVDDSDEMF